MEIERYSIRFCGVPSAVHARIIGRGACAASFGPGMDARCPLCTCRTPAAMRDPELAAGMGAGAQRRRGRRAPALQSPSRLCAGTLSRQHDRDQRLWHREDDEGGLGPVAARSAPAKVGPRTLPIAAATSAAVKPSEPRPGNSRRLQKERAALIVVTAGCRSPAATFSRRPAAPTLSGGQGDTDGRRMDSRWRSARADRGFD